MATTDDRNNCEIAIKQLIDSYVQKCFERRMTRLSDETNVLSELKRLRAEASDRLIRLNSYLKTYTINECKETQFNSSLTTDTTDDYTLKVKVHKNTPTLTNGSAHTTPPHVTQCVTNGVTNTMTNGVTNTMTNGVTDKLVDKHSDTNETKVLTNGLTNHVTERPTNTTDKRSIHEMKSVVTSHVPPVEIVTIDSSDDEPDTKHCRL